MFNKLINIKIKRIQISFMISKLQNIKGVTSEVKGEPNKHYIFLDFDNQKLEDIYYEILWIQTKYNLGDMILVSDKEGSYRAFCFSKRTFREYIEILLESPLIDWSFIIWTLRRKKGTLRLSRKEDRQQEETIVIKGYEQTEKPKLFKGVEYETGSLKIQTKTYGR